MVIKLIKKGEDDMLDDAKKTGSADSEDLNWLPDIGEDRDIFIEFIKEVSSKIENIEAGIMELDNRPDDIEVINRLFREIHSIKGSAGVLNITAINKLAHQVESSLEDARDGTVAVNSVFIDNMFLFLDALKIMIQKLSDELYGSKK